MTAYSNEPLAFPVVEAALADDDGIPTLMAALKSDTGSSVPPLAHLLAFQHLHDVVGERGVHELILDIANVKLVRKSRANSLCRLTRMRL